MTRWRSAAAFLVLALVLGGCDDSAEEEKAWQSFKRLHVCKLTESMPETTSTGVTVKGDVLFSTTPPKQGWLCDDGVTYWRIVG